MADNLTDVGENLALDFLAGLAPTDPVTPLKLRLFTVAGSDSAAGTEVTGGSYTAQTVTIGAAASGAQTNSADVSFASMPAVGGGGVVAWDIVDSTGTPRRLWHGTFTVAKTTNSGDTFKVAAGSLALSLT